MMLEYPGATVATVNLFTSANEVLKQIVQVHEWRSTGDLAYQKPFETLFREYYRVVNEIIKVVGPKLADWAKENIDKAIAEVEQKQEELFGLKTLDENQREELNSAMARHIRLLWQRAAFE